MWCCFVVDTWPPSCWSAYCPAVFPGVVYASDREGGWRLARPACTAVFTCAHARVAWPVQINELLARPDQQVTITAFKSWMARERNLQTYTRRRPDIVSALGLAGEPEGPSAGGVGAAE